jgi:hypothetical protein
VRFSVFLTPTDLGEVQNINPRVCPNDCRSYVKTTCACIRYANVCIHVDMARYCNGLYGVMFREYCLLVCDDSLESIAVLFVFGPSKTLYKLLKT